MFHGSLIRNSTHNAVVALLEVIHQYTTCTEALTVVRNVSTTLTKAI